MMLNITQGGTPSVRCIKHIYIYIFYVWTHMCTQLNHRIMKHTTQRKKASSEYSHICKASSFVPITFKHFRLAYCVETTNLHFLYPSLMHPHTYAHSSHSIDSDCSNACPYRLAASAGHIYILTPSLVIAHTLTHSHMHTLKHTCMHT